MAMYIGANRGSPHLGGDSAMQKDNIASLDWEYTGGQFLFSINNMTPELADTISAAGSGLSLAVVRYHPSQVVRRNDTKKQKTYPHGIGESNDSFPFGEVIADTRISIDSYAPNYQNMDFTSIIDGLALKDNARYRNKSSLSTEKTSAVLSYSWRDYGFAIIKQFSNDPLQIFIESKDTLRMKLVGQGIGQIASAYNVINKKEIEITE